MNNAEIQGAAERGLAAELRSNLEEIEIALIGLLTDCMPDGGTFDDVPELDRARTAVQEAQEALLNALDCSGGDTEAAA